MRGDGNQKKPAGSRLFGGYLSDVAAHSFRLIVEIVGSNDVAALFLFGLAVIAVIWLGTIEGDRLFSIIILFAILLFYYRISGTMVRMAELRNEEIRLKLEADYNSRQLNLPTLDRPAPRPPSVE